MEKSNCPMPLEDIKERVLSAIVDLYRYDGDLLDRNANERSITHKLAEHLQRQFPGWNVDCEYNRLFEEPKRINAIAETFKELAKVIAENEVNGTTVEQIIVDMITDTKAKTVFPDVIIHKRGSLKNLVVIEVKKHSNRSDREDDELKLSVFTKSRDFQYCIGLLVEIGATYEVVGLTVYSAGKERKAWTKDWKTTLNKKLEVLGYGE